MICYKIELWRKVIKLQARIEEYLMGGGGLKEVTWSIELIS